MVFYFVAKDGTLMYMGKDKFENEDLIKYGWPEDVWFHVDNLSSAHVYVRLPPGKTMEDIPEDVVRECAQLVKENSIDGSKKATVTVIYTPWANLRKDGSMAVRRETAMTVTAASTSSRHEHGRLAHGSGGVPDRHTRVDRGSCSSRPHTRTRPPAGRPSVVPQ